VRTFANAQRGALIIDVDMDGAMKEWLPLLGAEETTQYWLECAYQCAKLDVQMAMVGTPYDPRVSGIAPETHFSRAPQWALANHPMGMPLSEANIAKVVNSQGKFSAVDAATQGREARGHYIRVRGSMPF